MAKGEDEGDDFFPPTPRPGGRDHQERWKGRDKGAKRGRKLKRRMDEARAKTVRNPRDAKGKGCAVTALAAAGAAGLAALRARGWM